ncbi:MAG: hypothetical protein ABIQ59_17985 [Nocardioidaceae bacterium]
MLLGNPLPAATSAPQLLPTGWSAIGHGMPLGATVDLLRGISGLDGHGTALPALALASWVILGLTLLTVASRRRRTGGEVRTPEADPVPAQPEVSHPSG